MDAELYDTNGDPSDWRRSISTLCSLRLVREKSFESGIYTILGYSQYRSEGSEARSHLRDQQVDWCDSRTDVAFAVPRLLHRCGQRSYESYPRKRLSTEVITYLPRSVSKLPHKNIDQQPRSVRFRYNYLNRIDVFVISVFCDDGHRASLPVLRDAVRCFDCDADIEPTTRTHRSAIVVAAAWP